MDETSVLKSTNNVGKRLESKSQILDNNFIRDIQQGYISLICDKLRVSNLQDEFNVSLISHQANRYR